MTLDDCCGDGGGVVQEEGVMRGKVIFLKNKCLVFKRCEQDNYVNGRIFIVIYHKIVFHRLTF